MDKRRLTTMRISEINSNWLELERLDRKLRTKDDALTIVREAMKKVRGNKDYVFHL